MIKEEIIELIARRLVETEQNKKWADSNVSLHE